MTEKARKTKAKAKKPKTKTPTKRQRAKRKAADAAIAAMDAATEQRKPGQRGDTYKVEYDEKAFKLCLLGYTDKELGEYFEVSEQTINNWKKAHPSFFESIRNGKEMADANVAHGLYQRATGMTLPDVHVSNYKGSVTVTPLIQHLAPDVKAAEAWLRNRQSKRWNKVELPEGGGMLGIFINETLRPAPKAAAGGNK